MLGAVALVALAASALPAAAAAEAGALSPSSRQHHSASPRAHREQVVRRLRSRILAKASIVGGELAQQGQFPSLVYIADFKGEEVGLCTGTVIAPRLVLTAAHCAEDIQTGVVEPPSGYRIVMGAVNWSSSSRTVAAVSRVIVYPGFNREAMTGDVALLELSSPTSTPPMALAGPADGALTAAGTPAIVAGWGDTRSGQQAPTESLRFAETVIQGSGWCRRNAAPFDEASQLCALDPPSYSSGPCEGDSGGPLMVEDPATGGMVEVGITSQGPAGCTTTYPSIFTRASLIYSWAQEWASSLGGSGVLSGGGANPPATTGSGASGGSSGSTSIDGGAGVYRGRTSQHGRSIGVVVGSHGKRLTALATSIVYRCRSGHTLSAPLEGLSGGESARIGKGHRFTVVFVGPGTKTTIHGSLDPAAGRLQGTLRSVWRSRRYGRCAVSHLHWTASRVPPPSATVALAPHGGYMGRTASHGSIALRIASSGRDLTGISFSALYLCRRHHHTLHRTDEVLSVRSPEALASAGTFTLRLAGSGQRGRIDGTFSLVPNVAFGTLKASISTRRWGVCKTGLLTWRAVLR